MIRRIGPPGTDIGPGEYHFFATMRDEILDLRDYIIHISRSMSPASLNSQTKRTEIITSRLDDDEFFGMEERFWCCGYIFSLRLLSEKFDFVLKLNKFWIDSIKIRINHPIP